MNIPTNRKAEPAPISRWGIGPKWVLCCALGAVPLFIINAVWPGALAIHLVPRPVLQVVGCVLLLAGVPFLVMALWVLHRGFSHGKLFTSGVYGLCRHPIYASWIVFLVPGILLLVGSWAFLLLPPLMYASLRFLVREEEAWLAATFQDEYRAYRRRVPAVFPVPRFWRRD